MDSVDPEELRMVVEVALGCAPRTVKKEFADRYDPKEQAASRELSRRVAKAVLTYLHHLENPLAANTTPPYRYSGS